MRWGWLYHASNVLSTVGSGWALLVSIVGSATLTAFLHRALHMPPYLVIVFLGLFWLVLVSFYWLNLQWARPRKRLEQFFRAQLEEAYDSSLALLVEIAQNLNIGHENPLAAHIRFAVVEPAQELFGAVEHAVDAGAGTKALERYLNHLCSHYRIIKQSVLATLDVPAGIDHALEARWRHADETFRVDLRTLANGFAQLRNEARAAQ